MRVLFELSVFVAISIAAIAVVFGSLWILGLPFGVPSSHAFIISIAAVVFWFPAFVNVHIAVSCNQSKTRKSRICAGMRAFGLLLSSMALFCLLFFNLTVWQFLFGVIFGLSVT
jgi:hypothetical protein